MLISIFPALLIYLCVYISAKNENLYKTGDSGTTALFGGKRLSKDDIRIEAYGTVDELNSFIGLLNASFSEASQNYFLTEVQKRLFTIGSNLASDPDKNMITSNYK
ncbi:MAG: ATP:cob(I)alamin adenosyltransferase [Saprospiraceae bacterium]|nr:ATP:cob(I)alamin adenosyltransferase [Saprospiraceae bacterium]